MENLLTFNQFIEQLKKKRNKREIFNDDNKLKIYTKEEWNLDFITLRIEEIEEDDELPF